ncbi:MAG TPA: GNAT family N-acetyltransferase [Thermoanaerobaculia bacterium]|nr:GNAT family N-acetyltransferase [Thermoanaerobaculia bacterium]
MTHDALHDTATIRTLRAGEREALLELLDGWPLRAGRRGRDFFRRYVDDDPAYVDDNVWVAEVGGRLVSCVQVFPRLIRSTAGEVLCGGIGSVFTATAHRRGGLSSRLLGEATAAMRARGMEVSLLVAGRIGWYRKLGWRPWCPPMYRLRRRRTRDDFVSAPTAAGGDVDQAASPEIELSDVEVDVDGSSGSSGGGVAELDVIHALSERTSALVIGSVARGREGWEASLRLAGNPGEHFRLARGHDGEAIAFVRLCDLDEERQVTEWACVPGAEGALAGMLASELPESGSLALPPVADAALFDELAFRGLSVEPARGAAWMLRCLDREALALRLGLELSDADRLTDDGLLEQLFPRDRFGFWTADRF